MQQTPPRRGRFTLRPAGAAAVLAAAALALPHSAKAHDTWFAPRGVQLPGQVVLALGTGDPFPAQQSGIDARYLVEHACRQGTAVLRLEPIGNTSTALLMRVQAAVAQPLSCWTQLTPFELELDSDKIGLYLDEIDAPPAIRAHWAALAARGLPWRERYAKHARVELAGVGSGVAQAAPMAMDVLLHSGLQRIVPGAVLTAQVLRDGRGLADFAVQLRGSAGQARWLRTDADGRLRFEAPAAGRWILRGTDLRPDAADAERWDSRFVTLAFEVHAARPPD